MSTPEREINFQGRAMWVKVPSPEAILVWQRTVRRLQGEDVTGWNGAQVMQALERARKIIDSVLANDIDKDWLDDGMLDGTIKFQEATQIIQLTLEAFAETEEPANRAERRAATKRAPAKKAVRRKPAAKP